MDKNWRFGLVGRNINYSFSRGYFSEKFGKESLDFTYENFDLDAISELPEIIANTANLGGLNVTIPYKETVIPYLNKVSKKATLIGAVNTIKISKSGKLKGYNTDWYGFKKSVKPLLHSHHKNALILGTGGAAKAVAFALKELGISFTFVSRKPNEFEIGYESLTSDTFDQFQIVINCTPIGTSPDTAAHPEIPFQYFNNKHIAYDLIYNPGETTFLRLAREQGAVTKNGYSMLVFQAEKAWKIWRK